MCLYPPACHPVSSNPIAHVSISRRPLSNRLRAELGMKLMLALKGQNGSGLVALQVESVLKSFGTIRAVDGISLNLNRGEVLGLLGPNCS